VVLWAPPKAAQNGFSRFGFGYGDNHPQTCFALQSALFVDIVPEKGGKEMSDFVEKLTVLKEDCRNAGDMAKGTSSCFGV